MVEEIIARKKQGINLFKVLVGIGIGVLVLSALAGLALLLTTLAFGPV